MSQATYDDGGGIDGLYAEPERTSIAAILSLVSSMICCIPGLSVLGMVLGVFGLMSTTKSGGRVGGKGLAVAGLVIGLLVTVLWVGGVIGGAAAASLFINKMSSSALVLEDIEAGSYDAVRAKLVGSGSSITDEQMMAFHAAYSQNLGEFKSSPAGIMQYITEFAEMGTLMQNFQGRQDLFPVPCTFDNGQALMLIVFDQSQTATGGTLLPIADIWIVEQDGTEHRLSTPIEAPAEAP